MRTVTYKSVLDRIAGYLQDAGGLHVEDAALANAKINMFARLAWEFYPWPELKATELRYFRSLYDPLENVSAPSATVATERYHVPSQAYYQVLTAQSPAAQAPATLTGGAWVENSAYWAACAGMYSGDDWATGVSYTVGKQVRNPADNRYYQCTVAHTSGSSLDTSKFGILTPFVRSVAYEQVLNGVAQTKLGEVLAVWDTNPEVNPKAIAQPYRLAPGYVVVRGCVSVPWVEFRKRPNVWTGATRTDQATYAAGDERYDTATGDYWTANQTVSAGQSPTTTPAKWNKVEFPYVLAEYVAQSAAASLKDVEEEQPENWNMQQTAGWPLLAAELDKVERQQGQTRQLNVLTGRG